MLQKVIVGLLSRIDDCVVGALSGCGCGTREDD